MAEATKDQLQEQIVSLKTELATAKQDLATANQERQATKDAVTVVTAEKEELQAQLTDERSRSGNLAGELNEAENLIEELQNRLKLAAVQQAESDTVIVSDGTDHYKVLAPRFKFKHVEYTAKDLTTNLELLQQLVKADVGFLQKIETEE